MTDKPKPRRLCVVESWEDGLWHVNKMFHDEHWLIGHIRREADASGFSAYVKTLHGGDHTEQMTYVGSYGDIWTAAERIRSAADGTESTFSNRPGTDG